MSVVFDHAYRLTVADVLRWAALGAFDEGPRVELLHGVLVEMTPQGDAHWLVGGRLAKRLRRALGEAHDVVEEKPFAATATSLPEPDLLALRGTVDALQGVPTGDEVALVVEVSVTSHAVDRAKAELYAQAGVPMYWLVDVPRRQVQVRSRPVDGHYARLETVAEGEALPLPLGWGAMGWDGVLPPLP